jgi:acetyl-CoA carboxylase carboxyl transferase subunit alpha
VDEVLEEPLGGAHRDPAATAEVIRNALLKYLVELDQLPQARLLEQREQRVASFGKFKGA